MTTINHIANQLFRQEFQRSGARTEGNYTGATGRTAANISRDLQRAVDNWHGNVANGTADFVGNNNQLASDIAIAAGLGYTFSGGSPLAAGQGAAAGMVQSIISQVMAAQDGFDASGFDFGQGNGTDPAGSGGYDFGGWGESSPVSFFKSSNSGGAR